MWPTKLSQKYPRLCLVLWLSDYVSSCSCDPSFFFLNTEQLYVEVFYIVRCNKVTCLIYWHMLHLNYFLVNLKVAKSSSMTFGLNHVGIWFVWDFLSILFDHTLSKRTFKTVAIKLYSVGSSHNWILVHTPFLMHAASSMHPGCSLWTSKFSDRSFQWHDDTVRSKQSGSATSIGYIGPGSTINLVYIEMGKSADFCSFFLEK